MQPAKCVQANNLHFAAQHSLPVVRAPALRRYYVGRTPWDVSCWLRLWRGFSPMTAKMLVLVPVLEEVTALESDQAWEAPGQVRVWDWAERPARQGLVQVLLTSPLPTTASAWFQYHHQSHTCHLFSFIHVYSWQQRGDSGKSNHYRDYQSDDHQNPTGQQHNLANRLRSHYVIPPHCSLLASQIFERGQRSAGMMRRLWAIRQCG
jgi:hypothetical protein